MDYLRKSGGTDWVSNFIDDDYLSHQEQVRKVRDLMEGEDWVKSLGKTYLAAVNPDWTDGQYGVYKSMAVFKNYIDTIQNVYTGMVFEKSPMIELPEKIKYLKDDITTTKLSIDSFTQKVFREAFVVGRGGVLVDWDTKLKRCYARLYATEDVLNFGRDETGALTLLVLADYTKDSSIENRFKRVVSAKVRVFELVNGICVCKTYSNATDYVERVVDFRGKPLNFIPFSPFGAISNELNYNKPPMLGVANLNLHHYRSYAQLEHSRAWSASPTPVIKGIPKETFDRMSIAFGPSRVMLLENKDAELSWVELKSDTLPQLESAVKEKELLIAKESAAFLMDQKREAETTGTAKLRDKGNKSSIQVIIKNVTDCMWDVLAFAYFWETGTVYDHETNREELEFEINSDLQERSLEPATITALYQMRLSNLISADTFYDNLRAGALMKNDKTTETELKDIEASKIVAPTVSTTPAAKVA